MVAKTLVAVASFVGLAVSDSYVYRPAAILPPNPAHPAFQQLVYATNPTFYHGYPALAYMTPPQQLQQPQPSQATPRKECDYLDAEYEINVSIDRQKRSA